MKTERFVIVGMIILWTFFLTASLPGQIASGPEEGDGFGFSVCMGDFNGDGYLDCAVGVPFESVGPAERAGAVQIIYGTADGLTVDDNQFWHQNSEGIEGDIEDGDLFGYAVCSGDFNGDGYDDLAVGAPGEAVGALLEAGAVNVIYGSADGLNADGNKQWYQDKDNIDGDSEAEDEFGRSVAAGDFNGDGYDDLAVGVPGEAIGQIAEAGLVNVIYGSADGLTDANDAYWHQDTDGIEGFAEEGDRMGHAVCCGDFNGDGYDDLAVGSPDEAVGVLDDAGAVNVLYGSADGLTATDNKQWYQDTDDIAGDSEAGDSFGASLAAGDFDGNGFDDLAVGVPGEAIGQLAEAGLVNVIYGSADGLTDAGNTFWHQDIDGIEGFAEQSDLMGFVSAGDFNGDGYDDLAAGSPGEAVGALQNAGAVNIIYGSQDGLTAANDKMWYQDVDGILDTSEAEDSFGFAVGAGDVNDDGYADAIIGIPGESIYGALEAGAVSLLLGSANGIAADGNEFWYQGAEDGYTLVISTGEVGPEKFTLHQNYPNPFNAMTTIRLYLPAPDVVKLKIYNLQGKEVATLLSGRKEAGEHVLTWDTGGLPSGVYLCRLETGSVIQTRKLILQK